MIFNVPDISCQHCKMRINKSLATVKGIQKVDIDVDKKIVDITGNFNKDDAIRAIEESGYKVKSVD
jgi:copper chaperone CopZ